MANVGLYKFIRIRINSQFLILKPLTGTLYLAHCTLSTTQTKLSQQYRYRHFSDNRSKYWSKSQIHEQYNSMEPIQAGKQNKGKESRRKMNFNLIALFAMIGIGSGALAYTFGRPEVDGDGKVKHDSFSNMPVIIQFFLRAIHNIEFYIEMIKEPSRTKLLPDPLLPPYLQPPYTLVLEINDFLVHADWTYNTGWRFKKRPGVDKFLEQVGPPNFEVVIYTSEPGLTAHHILNTLDPNNGIRFRLFRDATDFIGGHHVKNLDYLNRDFKKIIVIDWNQNAVKYKNNTFLVPRWKGNDDDTGLTDLTLFLTSISSYEIEDVRNVLSFYSQFVNPVDAFRNDQSALLKLKSSENVSNLGNS